MAFAFLLLFAFITGGKEQYVGAAGAGVAGGLFELIGYVCYLIPALLIWWATVEFRYKKIPFKYSMFWGGLLFIIGASVFFHLVTEGTGGMLGDFVSDVIIRIAFGNLGAYIMSAAILLVSIIMITDISVRNIFNASVSAAAKVKELKPGKPGKAKIPAVKTGTETVIESKEERKAKKKEVKREKKERKKQKKTEVKQAPVQKPVQPKPAASGYSIPLDFLNDSPKVESQASEEEERGRKLKDVLLNFDIEAEVSGIQIGPSITRYEITTPPGVKLSKIRNLSSNIAMALEAKTVRLLTPIPGKSAVGVEVPAVRQETVALKDLIGSSEFHNTDTSVPYCLGKSVSGDRVVEDLAAMPHLLLAGATGSGKSVAIHTLIMSILYKSHPNDAALLLMDPKRVELPIYNGIPHLVAEVVTDPGQAVDMLQAVVKEMDSRYDILAKNNAADIKAYNKIAKNNEELKVLPRFVVVIDELADLMVMAKDRVENAIIRLAQMSRAVGIHLVLATQRPSVDIITGIIKANLPARIAFNVLSGVDSRTILDSNGAEKLLGKGDMLYLSAALPQPERIQGCFISREEVSRVVDFLKQSEVNSDAELNLEDKVEEVQRGSEYEDELYPEAVRIVLKKKKASISMIQRKLRIGYNRAARIIDTMEENGIVGQDEGVKGRKVLVDEDYLENFK